MTRCALYLRVSTSGQSVDLQRRDLYVYCERRGWTVAGEFVDVCSGATQSRPELARLMDAVHKGKVDVVVVWRFDRFARSVSHLLRALESFQSAGVEFVSYSESIDTSSSYGKMVFTILGAVGELERSLIRERVVAGQRAAKANGVRFGRPRTTVRPYEVAELRRRGVAFSAIGKELGIAKATAVKLWQQHEGIAVVSS